MEEPSKTKKDKPQLMSVYNAIQLRQKVNNQRRNGTGWGMGP